MNRRFALIQALVSLVALAAVVWWAAKQESPKFPSGSESIAWLVAGRPRSATPRRGGTYERPAGAFPEYDRPGRAAGLSDESDEEFLRRCRERAEEQRRQHKARQEQQKPPPEPDAE